MQNEFNEANCSLSFVFLSVRMEVYAADSCIGIKQNWMQHERRLAERLIILHILNSDFAFKYF